MVDNVIVDAGRDAAWLVAADGRIVQLTLDAECCSRSEFSQESCDDLLSLRLHRIFSMAEADGWPPVHRTYDAAEAQLIDKYHCLLVRTDRASLTIDWRNTSNGYYDGELTISPVSTLPRGLGRWGLDALPPPHPK